MSCNMRTRYAPNCIAPGLFEILVDLFTDNVSLLGVAV